MPTSQRALEQHLRARWLERLLGYFIPFRHQISYMHQVMGARELEEFGHLFGDARFRTIRAHCLAYEGMRKIGFQNLPWTAGDVRHLMNQAVTLEVTPAKLQKWWGTLKWLSIKLGMLNVDEHKQLLAKRKAGFPRDAGGHPGQTTTQSGGSDPGNCLGPGTRGRRGPLGEPGPGVDQSSRQVHYGDGQVQPGPGDPDWEFPLTLKEGVPLGVSDPTLTSPGVWPTKEELKGEAWLGEDPVAHDNYPTAELFASEIEATFYEERALDMVDGPFTRSEAAERCRCKPEELCPGPLAGIDESDKIRTIYDGSKGGANAHIQAHTGEKTTAPMVGDCLHAIHWLRTAADHPHLLRAPLSGTEEKRRDVHQPVQAQSPGAEGPACPPGPRALIGAGAPPACLDVSLWSTPPSGKGAEGGPIPPNPPRHRTPWGEQVGTWQPPTQGETFILKADVTKAHRRIKVLPKDWKYQVACIQNRWWVNRVGTYGMASAQLYWGRKASLVLRLLYYIFPQVDWHLVFVDDYCWVLRCSRADWSHPGHSSGAGSPAFLEEDGALPGQYLVGICGGPNHALCAAGSSQGHNPGHSQTAGPEGHLHQQGGPGRIQWATSACPLTKPFLQPFWSWKKACTTSGRPPKLVRALAILLGKLFNQRFPLASPFAPTLPWTGASDAGAGKQADHAWVGGWCSDVPNPDKSRVKWFQHRITSRGPSLPGTRSGRLRPWSSSASSFW